MAIDAIAEVLEDGDAWSGPAKVTRATLARRAQSYSDFYEITRAYSQKERATKRRDDSSRRNSVRPKPSLQLEFDADLSCLDYDLVKESDSGYATYHEQLRLSESHLDNLLASTNTTLELLSGLSDTFRAVEAQTDTFRQQCEALVSEQRQLNLLADNIEQSARYYTYLEPMTRRLNAPGAANLVKGSDFSEMLSNLDNCLAYMESHPKQKEAATYRSRYRLLLTRALTLIRHHFTRSLGDIAADISKRIQGGQLKETTHSALLYAKFRVPAPELKALGLEIQKRGVPTPDDVDAGREPEYASLLRELYQSYSATRGRLILPLVGKKLAELGSAPLQADVLAFAKASISFMRGICLDEHELWYEWFETDGALYDFLESLMEPLYDYLRPKVIHETRLEKLCELCSTVQGRYMDTDSEEDDDEGAVLSPMAIDKPLGRKPDFAGLVQPVLEDAQTRLVFLALTALRDGIENYRPKPDELDWPKRMVTTNGAKKGPVMSGTRNSVPPTPMTPTPKTPTIVDEDIGDAESMFSKHFTTESTRAAGRQWYPTLHKAIWLLRRIYRLVNSTVFDDLAHRIVHSTIYSLMTASQQIGSKKTPADGQLFLITHLLHLKQQIVAFDIEFVPPEVEFDFSSVTNTFYELRERGSLWNPVSWVRLVSGTVGGGLLPRVVENMLDAKAELDGRLRTVINDIVSGYASHITAPLDASAVAQAKAREEFDAMKALRTVHGLAEKNVPIIRAKLEEFVDDPRTRKTLVAAIRDQVVMSYEEYFDIYSEGKGKKLSRKGKGREDEIWGPDLFSEAMERVFQVGQMVGEENDNGSGEVSD